MKRHFALLVALFFTMILKADPIPGFEDSRVLDRVLDGEILKTTLDDTETEARVVVRSFFKKVSVQAYEDLVTNYAKYPDMFEGVADAKEVEANPSRTRFHYWLDILVKVGPLTRHVYPEGQHDLVRTKLEGEGGRVLNQITNYKEYLEAADQVVRLIPYQDGILVEDTVHVKTTSSSKIGRMIKEKFLSFFSGYTEKLREALN